MDDKTITITRTQFAEAVKQACEEWVKVEVEDKDPMFELMMSVQNMTFGRLLGDILFEDKKEND